MAEQYHTNGSNDSCDAAKPMSAAQYVRMSTDHQKYSTENQADTIANYAARRGYEIVRTYADEGKSGLSIHGRDALQRLIDDVQSGRADFQAILVYDVSRWGRYQDADESAYYEHICKRAGIRVEYCAEQFSNDGSLGSAMIKSMKRVMAGEYSRELSVKVFAGQCRLIEKGFRQGGAAGFGLRRLLVNEHGEHKAMLVRGEHKSLQTDRVILIPGPLDEVEVVLRIYRMFVEDRMPERHIAAALNVEGLSTDLGRPWTRGTVHQILTNEKYIGNNVFNRVSFKLKQRRVRNGQEQWIRRDAAFTPIVPVSLYEAAQSIIMNRSARYTDSELLDRLRNLYISKGELSGIIIDEVDGMPSSTAYRHRFGTLLRAYQLVGYVPSRDYRYIEINRLLRRIHPGIVDETIRSIEGLGGSVRRNLKNDLLHINGEFTASIVIVRCFDTGAGSSRWKIRFDASLRPDITVAVRMAPGNEAPLDYYLFPRTEMSGPALKLKSENGIFWDAFRFNTLNHFFYLASRSKIRGAA